MDSPRPLDDCSTWIQSPIYTPFETLICIALVASYVPQYLRIASSGTFGISPYFILSTTLFSTTQLATHFSNAQTKFAFDCVNGGQIRGFKAFSALLGFIQAIVQWLCAVLLVVIFIKYRNDSPDPPSAYDQPPPKTPKTTHHPLSSSRLKIIIATYAIVVLPASLAALWRPDLVEDDFELDMWLTIAAIWFHFIWTLAAVPLVLLQYVPQILTTLSLRTRGRISLVSLALQIVVFVVLGAAQFSRLGIPTFGSPPHRHGPFQSYFDYLHVSLNYFVTAVGQLVLLVVCVVVDRGRHLYGKIALDVSGAMTVRKLSR